MSDTGNERGPGLDGTQLERYTRHVIMEEIGPAGQAALLEASVLVVGAGGLGSPVLQYLAAAGVGTLGIADDDVVERSNLQRQVVHRDADVGRPKVESAAEYVTELNPDVTVRRHRDRVAAGSVAELVKAYDLVVDASDNFPTRFLLNDAGVLSGTPLCHGAIFRFEGQVTTFPNDGQGPCYRCLFPEAPEPGTVPDCATTGVLGVLPGTVGCLMATEAVKWIVQGADESEPVQGTTEGRTNPRAPSGSWELLDGRLLCYDARDMTVETIEFDPDPDCPVCGSDPRIESLEDVAYEGTCTAPIG